MAQFHEPHDTATAWLLEPRSIGGLVFAPVKVIQLMNWNQCFARRTRHMKRSAVRELLTVASQPDITSFAGGLPDAELFPLDRVQAAVQATFKRVGGRSLQYAETEGLADLRDWIARRYSCPHLPVSRENILITSGAQQALDLIGRVLLNSGDRVVVENPTYLALLSAWRPWGVKFVAAASDCHGMRVEELDSLNAAHHPKILYLVPNFQNPQGTTLIRSRRQQLVSWLAKNNVACVEDDPYAELRYDGEHLPALFELDAVFTPGVGLESRVIRTGSFSKILMPGLRLGWVIAPRPIIEKLVQAKQASDLHTSSLSQYIALELVRSGFLEQTIPQLCKAYGERRDLMMESLHRHFADLATWTRPEGGMFLLVTLSNKIDTTKMLSRALAQNVAFVPGEEFHLNGEGRHTMRLNFSNTKPEAIESGIARLAEVVKCEDPQSGVALGARHRSP
jgi:2-aminoadipate transaminase